MRSKPSLQFYKVKKHENVWWMREGGLDVAIWACGAMDLRRFGACLLPRHRGSRRWTYTGGWSANICRLVSETLQPRLNTANAGNHQNQFVDFLLLTVLSSRRVSFLVASASLKRIVIRVFAYIMNCIPVHRQRDTAVSGTAPYCFDEVHLRRYWID